MTLQEAIKEIEKQHYSYQLPIQMIEFEDGSGNKFNYRLKNETKNRFIDLSKKSTEITEDIAIQYSTWLIKWCEQNKYRKLIDGVKPYGIGEFISDKDMFEKFSMNK